MTLQLPLVATVDFHHLRGPEVEEWHSAPPPPALLALWSDTLPFLALPDGAHDKDEELSYFTLRCPKSVLASSSAAGGGHVPQSLFGIACTRSIDSSTLIERPPDVTRSAVQKAVVAILDSPHLFGRVREKLSAVTKAWFNQRDFRDSEVVKGFWEDLVRVCSDVRVGRVISPAGSNPSSPTVPTPIEASLDGLLNVTSMPEQTKRDHEFVGLSLREIIHDWREKTLVLFKALLLQKRILFFGHECERLCLLQFSLVSLIPGLINALDDCADTNFNSYEESGLRVPENLQTSSRESLLRYMGLPIQIFGRGGIFGPYTPLQLLDVLEAEETKSYLCGSTNALVLRSSHPEHMHHATPAAKHSGPDMLVNLTDLTITILDPAAKAALALTPSDKRFIDLLATSVTATWDPAHPSRPNTLAYPGSEEFLRLHFEEYLLSFLAAVNYSDFLAQHPTAPRPSLDAGVHIRDQTSDAAKAILDPLSPFHTPYISAFKSTTSYTLWSKTTKDANLFDIVPPLHPCAGTTSTSLALEDMSRRIAELHLDERVAAVGASFAAGREKVGAVLSGWWSEVEAQRKRTLERRTQERGAAETGRVADAPEVRMAVAGEEQVWGVGERALQTEREREGGANGEDKRGPDWHQAKENMAIASQRASAYLASWGAWAGEKRRGWGGTSSNPSTSASRSVSVEGKRDGVTESVGGHGLEGKRFSGPKGEDEILSELAADAERGRAGTQGSSTSEEMEDRMKRLGYSGL